MPSDERLRRTEDYRRVFRAPVRSGDSFFLVLASVNGEQPARLGLAIAKKCAVRSVDRNRIKRIVRESFRHHRLELNGIDYVVLCRRKAIMAPNQALFGALAQHWLHVRDRLCAG